MEEIIKKMLNFFLEESAKIKAPIGISGNNHRIQSLFIRRNFKYYSYQKDQLIVEKVEKK